MAERKTIYDAILELRAAFERDGLKPTFEIRLKTPHDGFAFQVVARHDMPISHMPGSLADYERLRENEVEIYGIKVTWPLRPVAWRPED
jgi:hypothetical protein